MISYTCPMHPEIIQNMPGKCPKCGGMDLVLQTKPHAQQVCNNVKETNLCSYKPALVIVSLLIIASVLGSLELATGKIFGKQSLALFMASYFFVVSGLKLVDLKGFAHGYKQYNVVAAYVPAYAFVYPFIELILGTQYILQPFNYTLHIITIVLMVLSSIRSYKGVSKAQCTNVDFGTCIRTPQTILTPIIIAILALIMLML